MLPPGVLEPGRRVVVDVEGGAADADSGGDESFDDVGPGGAHQGLDPAPLAAQLGHSPGEVEPALPAPAVHADPDHGPTGDSTSGQRATADLGQSLRDSIVVGGRRPAGTDARRHVAVAHAHSWCLDPAVGGELREDEAVVVVQLLASGEGDEVVPVNSCGVVGQVGRTKHHDVRLVSAPREEVDLHVLVPAVPEPAAGEAHLDEAGLSARSSGLAARVACIEAGCGIRAQQPLQATCWPGDEVVVEDDLDGDLSLGARPQERVGDVGAVEAVCGHTNRAVVGCGVDRPSDVVRDAVLCGLVSGRVIEEDCGRRG